MIGLSRLEDLIENLYSEDIHDRGTAAASVCALFQDGAHLSLLLEHPALLTVLARLLREDGRKHLDLGLATVGLFCALSHFTQLQGRLVEQQIGARTLDLLSFVTHRLQIQGQLSQSPGVSGSLASAHSQLSLRSAIGRQQQLLYLCTRLLFNLSDGSATVRRKACKKGIIPVLADILTCSSVELLILGVSFLQLLTTEKGAVRQMLQCGIMPKLQALVRLQHPDLAIAALNCLHNIFAVDSQCCPAVSVTLLAQVGSLLREQPVHNAALSLLYDLSCTSDSRQQVADAALADRSLFKLLLSLSDIQHNPDHHQLACAALINLGHLHSFAEGVRADDVQLLGRRALDSQDTLLLKVLRVLTQHQDPQHQARFSGLVADLASLAQGAASGSQAQLEALGCLAHLGSLPASTWQPLVQSQGLVPWLARLVGGACPADDTRLEGVRLCQALALPSTADRLAQSDLPGQLVRLLDSSDPAILAQALWSLHAMLGQPVIHAKLAAEHKVVHKLTALMQATDQHVQLAAAIALDVAARCLPSSSDMA